jgi:formate dehydrogenase subunit delta
MSDTIIKLRYMADQIARNFAALGHENAVAATADHIATFWDPRMMAAIFAEDRDGLSPIAAAAIAKLAASATPPPQTRATTFKAADEAGRSDAG